MRKTNAAYGTVAANGISIAYKSVGDPKDSPVLVVQGVGGQVSEHTDRLTEELVRHGYRIITYDNRDIGHSTKFESSGLPDYLGIQRALSEGRTPPRLKRRT